MRRFTAGFAFVIAVAGWLKTASSQPLEDELISEFPEHANSIERLFEGNPQVVYTPEADSYAVRVGIGHAIGNGVGNPASFTTLESFIPFLEDPGASLVFGQMSAHIDNLGNPAVNLGLGARQVVGSGVPSVIGGSVWLDYRQSELGEHDYGQLGFGLEYLKDWLEIRSNIYLPQVDENRKPLPHRFSGNRLLIDRAAVAIPGVDVEAGVVLPAVGGLQGRIAGGYYYYHDSDVAEVSGWRARSELVLNENLSSEVTVSDDDVFGTTTVVRVVLHSLLDVMSPRESIDYPPIHSFRRGEDSHLTTSATDRLAERVRRNSFIVTGLDDGVAAINPATMMPHTFLFAVPGASGDGSFENPYGTISAAMADMRSGQAITYTPAGGTFAESVVMTNGSVLLSNGVLQTVDTQSGTAVLPFSSMGQSSPDAATITGSVTVGNASEVDGFLINSGVTGAGVGPLLLERNIIGNPGGDGIFLSGLSNMPGDEIVISDNRIRSGVLDGIRLDGTSIAATIQNNTIDNGAANGIHLSGGNVVAGVSGNTASQTTNNGLMVASAEFTGTISDNQFENGSGSGIRLDLTTGFHGSITNNMAQNNGLDGIHLFSPVIESQDGMSNASISGNVASGSQIGINIESQDPRLTIENNTADNTTMLGLRVMASTYPGVISGNQFNSGTGGGISFTTTGTFNGSILNNTANLNTGGNGIDLNVMSMFGGLSGNTANQNSGEGILVTSVLAGTNFTTAIDGNTASSNGLNGISLVGVNSTFEGAVQNNSASSNGLSGIRVEALSFNSDFQTNTARSNGLNGIEVRANALNGNLLQNTTGSNTAEGMRIVLNDPTTATSVVDIVGNTVSGNNTNLMVPGSQFSLENAGMGNVLIDLNSNISTDSVTVPEFNFELLNTGAGGITPNVVLPSSQTGTVGLNGVQIFP